MAYIGNTSVTTNVQPATDFFSGNGSTVAFTLSRTVVSSFTIEAVINNVQQNPASAYTVSGNVITFTSAPPTGVNNIYVKYNSIQGQVVGIGQGTVSPTQLTTGAPSWDVNGNLTNTNNINASGSVNSTRGFSIPTYMFEKIVGNVGFANTTPNLAVNVQFGNISVGGLFELTITSSYNYQNAGGGIKKIFAVLVNPDNNIYTNESRVTEAIGAIVNNFSIGEFQWNSSTSQYIIPISHLVSTANSVIVSLKVLSPGNADSAFTNVSLSSTYTLSALNKNYEYFNNNVGIGTSNPSYPLTVTTGDIYSSGALRPLNGQARLHFYSFSEGTMGGGYVHMKTNVYQTDTQMYSVHFLGHDYSGSKSISSTLGWYNYQPSNGPINIGGNAGTHSVSAYKSSDGYTVMVLGPTGGYYTAFTVSQYLTTQGLANLTISAARSTGSSTGAY